MDLFDLFGNLIEIIIQRCIPTSYSFYLFLQLCIICLDVDYCLFVLKRVLRPFLGFFCSSVISVCCIYIDLDSSGHLKDSNNETNRNLYGDFKIFLILYI